MTAKKSHAIRDGIIATVIGGAILSFLPAVRSFFVKSFNFISSVFSFLWNLLVGSYYIPGWGLLILIILSGMSLISIIIRVLPKSKDGPYNLYKEGFINGALWRWDYHNYSITNLWAYCSKCDGELVYDDFTRKNIRERQNKTDFFCERCGPVVSISGSKDYALGLVEREIRRKIRTGEWKRPGGNSTS